MKDQNQLDKGIRKSNRQRVPNPFYTEGINELKRAPRPARDPQPKQSRKRSIVYQQDGENSEEEVMQEEKSSLFRQSNDWFPCKLPKNGQLMKVQFVINQPEEPVVEKKKEEPPKIVKKVDTTFDLLSLFQKAIENVNDEVIHEKEVDIETVIKEPKIRKEFSIPKQRRVEDMEGRITGVELQAGKIVIKHTKIGETEIPIDSHGEMDLEPIHEAEIEEYRGRLLHSHLLGQISILN